MTQEEKRIKLAEAAGFTQEEPWLDGRKCWGHKKHPKHIGFEEIPDYFHDLNAVHELEGAGLNGGQYDAFVFHLLEIARRDGAPDCESDLVCCARATATQRAEALGLTLNLWK